LVFRSPIKVCRNENARGASVTRATVAGEQMFLRSNYRGTICPGSGPAKSLFSGPGSGKNFLGPVPVLVNIFFGPGLNSMSVKSCAIGKKRYKLFKNSDF
jgi:hypothetical protein